MLRIFLRVVALSALLLSFFAFASPTRAAACPPAAAGETDITGEGSVFASTIFAGFPKELSVDCDTATSWFSTGPEPGGVPTLYRWTGARDDLITTILVISNHDHPQFPTNFGFGAVTVLVRNAANQIVFQQENIPLPGTPDPDLVLRPNVVGRVVELLFTGHEANNCGGIAELRVHANRTPPTATKSPPTVAPPTKIPPTVAPPTAIPATVAPPTSASGSDDFNRPDTTDPCALGSTSSGGRQLFYLPIFPSAPTDPKPLGAHIVASALQNNGLDYGGFQFALSDACAQARGVVRGANMGQDLNLRVELLVPTNAAGLIAQAGPYFRSRAAAYADGIIGGESAGYWVQLESTGEIKIKRLNPQALVATSCKPASFDASKTHTLEIAASGTQLHVALDGKIQAFQENERVVNAVNIPATAGANNGTAGIAFGAEPNRGQIGGQRADNIFIGAFQPLTAPLEDNCASANNVSGTATAAAAVTPTTTNQQPTQVAVVPTTVAPATTGTGDCDNDTKLTELDALCALQMSVRLIEINLVMDIDGNGVVDSRDAVIILQRAVNK